MFASHLSQHGRSICLPTSGSRQRIPSVKVAAFTTESEPASFLPSSTYASLPKARIKRRVPLPAFPIADAATRHCVLTEVSRTPATCESSPSGSESTSLRTPPMTRMRLANGAVVLLPPGFSTMQLDSYASARLKCYKKMKAESPAMALETVTDATEEKRIALMAASLPTVSSPAVALEPPSAKSPVTPSAESTLCTNIQNLAKAAVAAVSPTASAAKQAFKYATVRVKATTRSVSLASVLEAANAMDSH